MKHISAIILAAGKSERMGQHKMLLPWGESTVLGHVIDVVKSAGVEDILIITGRAREEIENLAAGRGIRTAHNENFASNEMLESIQLGLQEQTAEVEAVLICLGDQPQIEERSVRLVCRAFKETLSNLVIPSYQNRRGHPWLAARTLWGEVLKMKPPQTPRDFLNAHAGNIHYVNVETPTVLQDIDTPEDYLKYKP